MTTRRGVLAAALAISFAPFRLVAEACGRVVVTDLGPFYPVGPIPYADDLFTRADLAARSTVVELGGRVLDADCKPVPNVDVEIWQCDAAGQYRHPRAPQIRELEPGFRYFAKVRTGPDGTYRFRTMRPAPYEVFGLRRAPHIHMRAGDVITEVYFAGAADDRMRASDPVFRSRGARRGELIVELKPSQSGALAARYDLTLT